MSILISSLKEELQSIERLEKKYVDKVMQLPNGSFIVRKRNKNQYGYLTFREKGKVVQKYLGKMSDAIIKMHRDYAKLRSEYKQKLKDIREQKKIVMRALRGHTK